MINRLWPPWCINKHELERQKIIVLERDSWKCNLGKLSCCCPAAQPCSTLRPHRLRHTRLPCLSVSPGVYTNSFPLTQWCHPTISSSKSPFLLPCIFPSIRVFSNESSLCIRCPKYWSFSISPSNEYSGLISFRIDWFDLFAVQETLKSLLQHHSLKTSIVSVLSLLYGPSLTAIHDYWKNHKESKSW